MGYRDPKDTREIFDVLADGSIQRRTGCEATFKFEYCQLWIDKLKSFGRSN